jgi:hypothetical protein
MYNVVYTLISFFDVMLPGYVGGSHYSEGGGAANFVCLPRDPVWGKYVDDHAGVHNGLMFGTEFFMNQGISGADTTFFGESLYSYYLP